MGNIVFGTSFIAFGSLYLNYILFKQLRRVELQRNSNFEDIVKSEKEHDEKICELNEKVDFLRGSLGSTQEELLEARKLIKLNKYDMNDKNLEIISIKLEYEDFKYDANKSFGKLEKLHKKLENDFYNLDWAYSELMKCYNSNAMDLYFWNLLAKSDRETRRKFIKSGKYKVYNLATGELCFEVI
ncbi:MAG: hypothetical protein ACRDAT_00950 [Cetobacterium sp.]